MNADMDDIHQSINELTSSVENASGNLWEMQRFIEKQLLLSDGDVLGVQAGIKPLVEVIEKLIKSIDRIQK
jgi:hypothetical protein|tara:strand:+ start:406 stop:618 length:213 start_codon:yes stop_codon:yes gene_type:complete